VTRASRRAPFAAARAAVLTSALLVSSNRALGAPLVDRLTRTFDVAGAGEVAVTIVAGCRGCDWGTTGREAAALRIAVDGHYSQHLLLSRGETPTKYRVALGPLARGRHRLTITREATLSAPHAGPATIEVSRIETLGDRDQVERLAQEMSPILYARPNTVGRFTDLPLVMWYEVVPTARGRQYRYSVIFSNEDGGTSTDRLMATWGRTTDIEFVYGVEIDESGRVIAEEFQGPGHEVPAFTGRHESRHPLLWVSTDNNMVSESGPTAQRYALVPERFDLTDRSREAVMDAQPWLYAVMSQELAREQKIVDAAPPGNGTIPDPRRFVYVETCAEVGNAALAIEIGARRASAGPDGALDWIPSDRGLRQYRIVRDGCARIATPLPTGVMPSDIRALRVLALERPPANGAAPVAPNPVRLQRINTLFTLDDRFLPQPSRLEWRGSTTIAPGGPPFELPIR
jgi:hypothetical protein